jgi:hypothetical protein
MRSPRRALVLTLCCAAVASCGGSSHHAATPSGPPAQRVCAGQLRAALAVLSGANVRIVDKDPTNIECLVSKGPVTADTIAQASELAWTQYDTLSVHLIQAFGTGSVHVASQLPHPVPGLGGNALWVPAQGELIATNGSQSQGGSYVTVKVKGTSSGLPLATAVARATLGLAPRGPNPPPPS